MERIVNQQYAELISYAIDSVPPKIMELIKPVHFFTGTDPIYAGLEIDDDISDGRSCKDTMHYLPIELQLHLPKSCRCPTIVIPTLLNNEPGDVVHELGHVLDDRTMWYQYQTDIIPVTEYAKTCFEEAFTEAFGAWLFEDYGNDKEIDEETLSIFNRLAQGY